MSHDGDMVPVSYNAAGFTVFTLVVLLLGVLFLGLAVAFLALTVWQRQREDRARMDEDRAKLDQISHMVAAPDQAWYWTPEWQAGERQADEEIAAGRTVGPMEEAEFEAYLDRLDAEADRRVAA